MVSENTQPTRFIPLQKWSEFHFYPTIAGLQWLRFNRHKNGFAPAFKKVCGRVLIDEAAFFECVKTHGVEK